MNSAAVAVASSPPAVGMLGPRNLRVSDEWYTRFRVAWDAAPSRVNGYKLVYQPEGTMSVRDSLDLQFPFLE